MAECKRYMRGLSLCLNVLLLVFGILMIGVGFSSGSRQPAELDQWTDSHGLLVLRVFGPVTLVLSLLGLFAAGTDTGPVLLTYCVLIFVEFVALMVVSAPLIRVQSEVDRFLEEKFQDVLPLHTADLQLQAELNRLQTSASCCGLRAPSDWELLLPPSCLCTPDDLHALLPTSSSPRTRSEGANSTRCVQLSGGVWAHNQACGPMLKAHLTFLLRASIGVISAFSTVMIAAMISSLALGLEKHWRRPIETTVDDYNRVKYLPKPEY